MTEQHHEMHLPDPKKPEQIKVRHIVRCARTGLFVAELDYLVVAGIMPYLSHWNDMVALHPVFSMEHSKLIRFASDEWRRLAKKAADDEISDAESNVLRVTFLALLHALDCVKQDKEIQCLPPLHIVYSQMPKLMALSYWKFYLESKRFQFPTYHIAKINDNASFKHIADYLDLCFEIKNDYEMKKHTAEEEAKLKAAQEAVKLLNDVWVSPPSKKALWKWIVPQLAHTKWQPDTEGWLNTLFLGGSSIIVHDFDKEDILLMEEIIMSGIEAGTGMGKFVQGRIDTIKRTWEQYHETYEVDLADFAQNQGTLVNGAPVRHPDPGPEPVVTAFANRAQYTIARAKWQVAKAAWDKQQSGDADKPNAQLEAI